MHVCYPGRRHQVAPAQGRTARQVRDLRHAADAWKAGWYCSLAPKRTRGRSSREDEPEVPAPCGCRP